ERFSPAGGTDDNTAASFTWSATRRSWFASDKQVSDHYFFQLPNRCNTTNATSSSRRWLPAKSSTAASTEKSMPLGLQPENVRAAFSKPLAPNSTPDSFLHSAIPSE